MDEVDIGGIENTHVPFQGKWQPCKRAPIILLILAICSFGLGTTEFVIAGILNILSKDLNVSIPAAGWVMTSYALSVMIGAPLITILTIRLKRKHVLTGLMILFIFGNLICSLTNNFSLLIVGRVVSALCHGPFFGISAVIASHIVEPKKRAMALALMFSGLTLANVIGVPLGTLIGEHFGWHSLFYIISGIGLIGLIGIFFFVPKQLNLPETNIFKELKVFLSPEVCLSLLVTALGFGGLFTSFSYIAPMLLHVTNFSQTGVAYLLALFGVGLVIGNFLGGKIADRSLKKALYVFLFLLVVMLFLFPWVAHSKWLSGITLFFLGIIGFGTVPGLQTQALRHASAAPTFASSTNIAAFNLGIALGIFLGGLAIRYGFGYTSPNFVGAFLTFCSLIIVIVLNNKYPLRDHK